jgi:hypothetical protein
MMEAKHLLPLTCQMERSTGRNKSGQNFVWTQHLWAKTPGDQRYNGGGIVKSLQSCSIWIRHGETVRMVVVGEKIGKAHADVRYNGGDIIKSLQS